MFNIVFDFKKELGGGKVFLKTLCEDLKKLKIYKDLSNSNYIIFNSHHNLFKILFLKFIYYDKIFLHRIDGPIYQYRNSSKKLDVLIFSFARIVSDGILFQSRWSYENNKIFFNFKKPFLILNNYADEKIFKPKRNINNNKKIKIISSCWNTNVNKGISTYYYLDQYLDFNLYEFYFIGNKNLKFQNIFNLGKKNSTEISQILLDADIFISPSLYESCSNAVIEALTVGLFVFYKEGTSSSEFVFNGKSFKNNNDLISLLNNSNFKLNKISVPPINSLNYINSLTIFSKKLKSDKKRKPIILFTLFLNLLFFECYKKLRYYKYKLLNLLNINI